MTDHSAIHYHTGNKQLQCLHAWDIAHFTLIQAELKKIKFPSQGEITINGKNIVTLDSAGAYLLLQLKNKLLKKGIKVEFIEFSKKAQDLINIVQHTLSEKKPLPKSETLNFFAVIGLMVSQKLQSLQTYFNFVGQLTFEVFRLIFQPKRWRIKSLINVLYTTGYQALPIIALLSFLIGIVLTYQMGLQLKNYGANIFIVDLLGLSVLREFSPLITAIMVSGRTGSAFTASLGMMKLNQEIDALDTMGVTPAELLLLPRILGLFIALPLLTMWSDIFGILGGMVMSNTMLDISWQDFLTRFPQVIPLRSFIIGIGKAPVFALLIASIGCFQGMRVKNSANSVGENTTKSVVLGIFFIIVADAVFSILFSKMHL